MIIPVSIRFKGTYDIVLRDTITGEIKDKRKIDNMLLNGFKRLLLDNLRSLRYIGDYCRIYIGTNNTPPSRSDTGIIGTSLAYRGGTFQISSLGEYPFTLTITVTFPAGEGTGSIGEIVLHTAGASPNSLSRIALDPKIDKTDTDELIITYTLTAHRLADVISGTIPGGQRDGVTDINWKLTFNNEQFYYFLYMELRDIPDPPRSPSNVRLGDSNADSDLINDKHDTLKGNQIASFTPFHYEWLQYSPENDYRDLRLGFERDQGKGNIAEITLYNCNRIGTTDYYYGVCRVTFDPPLDNTDPNYRLYLTFRFYIELGEETDVTIEGNNNNG